MTGDTARDRVGTAAGPCNDGARAIGRGAAGEEAAYAVAKPDTEAASNIVACACSRWEWKTWAWSLEVDCWWRGDGKGEIWDPLCVQREDRSCGKEVVYGSSIIELLGCAFSHSHSLSVALVDFFLVTRPEGHSLFDEIFSQEAGNSHSTPHKREGRRKREKKERMLN